MPMQLGEDKRGEMPDLFFVGARLAQAAAREATAHGEEQRDELAMEQCGRRHHQPDDRPCVRPSDETGEKCAFERQIGGVVTQ